MSKLRVLRMGRDDLVKTDNQTDTIKAISGSI